MNFQFHQESGSRMQLSILLLVDLDSARPLMCIGSYSESHIVIAGIQV